MSHRYRALTPSANSEHKIGLSHRIELFIFIGTSISAIIKYSKTIYQKSIFLQRAQTLRWHKHFFAKKRRKICGGGAEEDEDGNLMRLDLCFWVKSGKQDKRRAALDDFNAGALCYRSSTLSFRKNRCWQSEASSKEQTEINQRRSITEAAASS